MKKKQGIPLGMLKDCDEKWDNLNKENCTNQMYINMYSQLYKGSRASWISGKHFHLKFEWTQHFYDFHRSENFMESEFHATC